MKDGRIGVIGGGLGGLAAACTLAARGYEVVLFEKNAWLGRQGGRAARSRLSLRHGADDPADALGAEADLRRGRAGPRRRARPDPARSAVALVLRGRLDARPPRRSPPDGRSSSMLSPRAAGPVGLSIASSTCPRSWTRSRIGTSSGGRSAACRTCSTPRPRLVRPRSRTCCACGPGARSRRRSARSSTEPPRRADARPLHAVRRLVARSLAGRPVRHRPHADRRGRLVSAGRDAGRRRGADPPGRRTGRRAASRASGFARSPGAPRAR